MTSVAGIGLRELPFERKENLTDHDAEQLMLLASRGHAEAFEVLYERYRGPIYNFFYRLCWRTDAAEDMTQETFLRLWRAAPRFRPQGKLTTYLFQIAKNHWLNEREKQARRRHPSLDDDTLGSAGPGEGGSLKERLQVRAIDPADAASLDEQRRLARTALDTLDERYRMVVILAHFHGLVYREIAEVMEIPLGTVKSRMSKAERLLRDAFRRHHLAPEDHEGDP